MDNGNVLLTVREFLIERGLDGHERKIWSAQVWNTALEVLEELKMPPPVALKGSGRRVERRIERKVLGIAWNWIYYRTRGNPQPNACSIEDTTQFRGCRVQATCLTGTKPAQLEGQKLCASHTNRKCDHALESQLTICRDLEPFVLCSTYPTRPSKTP